MNRIIFLSAVIAIVLGSCKKEEVKPAFKESIKATKTPETNSEKVNHCVPWRDVADVFDAASDLNALVVCNTSTCSNGATANFYPTNNKTVNDTGGSQMLFPYTPATVTIADQNYIWSNALNQAIASAAAGYSVSYIYNFRPELVVIYGFSFYVMKFDIVYVKCGNGGGQS